MLEKQSSNCVHTSITRESVMIYSTQVFFTAKCPGMNTGIPDFEKLLRSVFRFLWANTKKRSGLDR